MISCLPSKLLSFHHNEMSSFNQNYVTTDDVWNKHQILIEISLFPVHTYQGGLRVMEAFGVTHKVISKWEGTPCCLPGHQQLFCVLPWAQTFLVGSGKRTLPHALLALCLLTWNLTVENESTKQQWKSFP